MLAIEICSECKFLDDEDIPNLWCTKIHDFINGSEMSELAKAGCAKMRIALEIEQKGESSDMSQATAVENKQQKVEGAE